jgi:hypothetical protein
VSFSIKPSDVNHEIGSPQAIYNFGTNILFSVDGGSNAYEYDWDLNGDGAFDAAPFEQGGHLPFTVVSYDLTESANSVQLLPNILANRRATYNVAVKLTSGLILHKTIRVALDTATISTHAGTALPAMSTAGIRGLYPWNNTVPINWDEVTDGEQAQLEDTYGIVEIPKIQEGNRLQFAPDLADNQDPNIYSKTDVLLSIGANPNPADNKVRLTLIGPRLWNEGWHEEELRSVVEREKLRAEQEHFAKDPDTIYGILRSQNVIIVDAGAFFEAESYVKMLQDPQPEWAWHIQPASATIARSQSSYEDALEYLSRLRDFVSPEDYSRVRSFLQGVYQNIPFEEMKKSEYAFYVRPPE